MQRILFLNINYSCIQIVDHIETTAGLFSHMKMKQKSVRLADIMGADFKGAQEFTDFVMNGVQTAWRADLGVETKCAD